MDLGLEFEIQKFLKVQSSKTGVMVHANTIAHSWLKSDFSCMNSWFMSRMGEGSQVIEPNLTLFVDMFVTLTWHNN